MRIGFLVWNTFQVGHFAEIMAHCDKPEVIFTNRDVAGLKDFDPLWLDAYGASPRHVDEMKLAELDGAYDAIVTAFTPALRHPWTKTKLVMCQYSLAKPKTAYNKRWTTADLGLVYGDSSERLIGPMCPTRQMGNPRFDPFFEGRLDSSVREKLRASLDPAKKTLLFLPTWGDLSSQAKFNEALSLLTTDYNVLCKPHHMTPLRDAPATREMSAATIDPARVVNVLDIGPYAMDAADVVISDMSGAIFDALYCRKPTVLIELNKDYEKHNKADPSAIEIARRDEIGPTARSASALREAVDMMCKASHPYREKNEALVRECFLQRGGCGPIAANALTALARGEVASRRHDRSEADKTALLSAAYMSARKRRKARNVKPPHRSSRSLWAKAVDRVAAFIRPGR